MRRIVATAGALVVLGFAAVLVKAGLAVGYAVTIAAFLAGLLAVVAGRVGDRFDNFNLLTALGWVLLFFAPIMLARAWGESGFRPNGFLRWLLAVAIEVSVLTVLALVFTALYQLLVRGRRERERRRLATAQGWRYEPPDTTLVKDLGPTLHLVLLGSFVPYAAIDRPVRPGTQARAVVRGRSNGIDFTAADFYRPGRLHPPESGTAVVVRLDWDVPPFTAADVFRLRDEAQHGADGNAAKIADLFRAGGESQDGADSSASKIADPTLARLVATPEITALTLHQLPSWWFGGRALVAASRNQKRGAANDELVADIAAVTQLATMLRWQDIRRYAIAG